jgi:6-phosphogluconolactonase
MKGKISAIILAAAMVLMSAMAVLAKDRHANDVVGAVYAMTNAADNNEVVMFDRNADGMLTFIGAVSTGGTGSGGGLDELASQGSLVLSDDHRWLLAVNAGSDEISVFRVKGDGLDLVDGVDSGGEFPVSLTVFHDLVYVLNAGMSPNITGFYMDHTGRLVPLDNSTRLLGTGGFAQVGFDPRGSLLVVTDRDENEILVYMVGERGLPSLNPVTSMSNGMGPFGFIFDERGNLLVSEAGSGAVSAYQILRNGELQIISPSVANGQTATCWIAANMRGNIFTANTGSQTISAYKLLRRKGKLALLNATAGSGNRPIDMAVTLDNRFLYALDPADGALDSFQINRDGSLTGLGSVAGGLSIFAQGIAAR